MLNNVCLMGRLVRDPELKKTDSGKSVLSFCVAVDKQRRDDGADFIDCVAWQQTADFINQYFHKGKMICINGRLTARNWEDKNGSKRKTVEVVVNSVDFCGDRNTERSDSDDTGLAYREADPFVMDDDAAIPF